VDQAEAILSLGDTFAGIDFNFVGLLHFNWKRGLPASRIA